MDEYKEALYNRNRKIYDKIDPGDLTAAFALKKSLNCKPFKYFLEVIASDLNERYPAFEKPRFAFGAIYSEANSTQCVTFDGPELERPLKLMPCTQNYTHPAENQMFELSSQKCIRYPACKDKECCIDAVNVGLAGCHYDLGNQYYKFDLVRKSFAHLLPILNFFTF